MINAFVKIYYIALIVLFVGNILIRKNIRKHSNCYSRSIQEIIEKLLSKIQNKELKDNYYQRKKEYTEWNNSKKLNKVEINQKIDVRDTEDIWCIGIIKKILKNSNHSNTLLIHYQGIIQ